MSFVLRHVLPVFALALTAALSAHALRAQTPPAPPLQQGPGGVAWVSGGADQEERAAMAPLAGKLPFTLVLSASAGEYVIADRLAVSDTQGEVLVSSRAGPIVMMRLPPGLYTIEATVQGRTEQRDVSVGKGSLTLDWRWPS